MAKSALPATPSTHTPIRPMPLFPPSKPTAPAMRSTLPEGLIIFPATSASGRRGHHLVLVAGCIFPELLGRPMLLSNSQKRQVGSVILNFVQSRAGHPATDWKSVKGLILS